MGLEIEYIDGQTPLDEEEKEGLLLPLSQQEASLMRQSSVMLRKQCSGLRSAVNVSQWQKY